MIGHHKVTYDEHDYIESVEILYRSSISNKMDKVKVISPHLLRFSDLGQKFIEVIKSWFILIDKLGAAYHLYFGVMYNFELYLTNKFLMLAEALEIFMGILSERNPQTDLEMKVNRINNIFEILDACQSCEECRLSGEDKEWIKTIMKDKKFLSFKEKMEKAYDRYSEILPKLSSVIGSEKDFAFAIQNSRNRLTHGNINYDQLYSNDEIKDIYLIRKLIN